MAAKNPNGANIEELTGKTEKFIEDNSRNIIIAISAVAFIIVSVVGYAKFIVEPRETAANEDTWRAEQYFLMKDGNSALKADSLALNGDGLYPGLYDIVEDHDGTKAAARAQYELGILLREEGDFEGAIEAFENAALNDDVLAAIVAINIGDCEVELGNYEGAEDAFSEAISEASRSIGEDFLAPIALYKGALVDLELDNPQEARTKLRRIAKDYPSSNLQATAEGLAAAI